MRGRSEMGGRSDGTLDEMDSSSGEPWNIRNSIANEVYRLAFNPWNASYAD